MNQHSPSFSRVSTDHIKNLYIPIAYNFMAVDGVILLLDRAFKLSYPSQNLAIKWFTQNILWFMWVWKWLILDLLSLGLE